jgi:hypothetical protein
MDETTCGWVWGGRPACFAAIAIGATRPFCGDDGFARLCLFSLPVRRETRRDVRLPAGFLRHCLFFAVFFVFFSCGRRVRVGEGWVGQGARGKEGRALPMCGSTSEMKPHPSWQRCLCGGRRALPLSRFFLCGWAQWIWDGRWEIGGCLCGVLALSLRSFSRRGGRPYLVLVGALCRASRLLPLGIR